MLHIKLIATQISFPAVVADLYHLYSGGTRNGKRKRNSNDLVYLELFIITQKIKPSSVALDRSLKNDDYDSLYRVGRRHDGSGTRSLVSRTFLLLVVRSGKG